MIVFLILAVLGMPNAQNVTLKQAPVFDFTFVESALVYLETGDESVLSNMVDSPAARHLAVHASRISTTGQERSSRDVVDELMHPRDEKKQNLKSAERLLSMLKRDPIRQRECLSEALAYLPDSSVITGKLYLTYGYDIGVAVSGNASLNLAHDHFARYPEEVWYYCIHELHHAGFQRFHDLPQISSLKTTHDLVHLIEYATQLEGMAVHAVWRQRMQHNAMSQDEDYVALQDGERMARYEEYYFDLHRQLSTAPARPLTDSDWAIVDRMSGGDRLWYRVGARMASVIEATYGRSELLRLVQVGPRAFFDAYCVLRVEGAPTNWPLLQKAPGSGETE